MVEKPPIKVQNVQANIADSAKRNEQLTTWKKFLLIIYNPEKNEILTRTPKSWARVSIFYLVFFILLFGFFAACMSILLATTDMKVPKYTLGESLIGINPGAASYPQSNYDINVIGLTDYNAESWIESLNGFLKDYFSSGKGSGSANLVYCDYNRPPGPGEVCKVDMSPQIWGPCSKEKNYGYANKTPCVFIKLNKLYDWLPVFYNSSNLPKDMPDSLKSYVKGHENEQNTIWVSCSDVNSNGTENTGPITYYPRLGFPGYYYPYTNIDGYLSPLVALHFEKPAENRVVQLSCRFWAQNLISDEAGKGHLRFDLLLE